MQKDITPQSKFDKRVGEWKKMDRSTSTNRKHASDFYDREIFPTVTDIFVGEHGPEKEYDGLILTVGFSPQPLILSIKAINPKRIALLHSSETMGFIKHIRTQGQW